MAGVGISAHCVTASVAGNFEGDNPIYTVSLVDGGEADFSALDRFIAAEDCIVIYDKYINEAGMELIEHIAKVMANGSFLKIFTSKLGARCLRPFTIAQRLTLVNPKIYSSCLEVSEGFRRLAHDRYLFCGSRLQMVFTAGIDSFGKRKFSGKRINRQSKVNIYSVGGANSLNIEASDGTICCVNSVASDLA